MSDRAWLLAMLVLLWAPPFVIILCKIIKDQNDDG